MSRNLNLDPPKRKLKPATKWVVDPSNRAIGLRMELATTDALCKSTLAAEIEAVRAKLMAVRQETTQLRAENLELRHLKYQLEEQLKASDARQAIPWNELEK